VGSIGRVLLLKKRLSFQMMMAVAVVRLIVMVVVMTWTLLCCVRLQAALASRKRVSRWSASPPTQTATSAALTSPMVADGE
jgi:hypothetical protein